MSWQQGIKAKETGGSHDLVN